MKKNNKETTLKKWGELLDKMGLNDTSTTKINIAQMMESQASTLLKEEMNKQKYNQIIDEVYNKYTTKYMGYDDVPSKELFLFEIKNNTEFSEKWGLKIEEHELSLEDRIQFYYKRDCSNGKSIPDKILKEELKSERTVKMLDKLNIPTKLITLTYNNETIESYE
jgi:hypothetical protein